MMFEDAIKKIENSEGNYCRSSGTTYISPENMKIFANYLTQCEDIQDMLVTPYLINLEDSAISELLYHQFMIEILDVSRVSFLEFPSGNTLPKEIVDNIKPKVTVPKGNRETLSIILNEYLTKMDEMLFAEYRNCSKSLEKAMLFYEIF